MKKTMLVIAMILIITTAGLFAAAPVPGSVKATLKANINEYLQHGFNDGVTKYLPAIDVPNAFAAITPTFKYGYATNASGQTFTFKMTVKDFMRVGGGGRVKIESVSSSGGQFAQILSTNVYQVFVRTPVGVYLADETTLTIKPFLTYSPGAIDITGSPIGAAHSAATAAPGPYEAEILFAITAV